ncbi:D-alanine--D-alanine ligase family protein [Anaerocolumna xylanovorans]|uniref:D-alanine--D-alanine ligase n=1 Tax=Anaerocolumna xylanovorans DSM 12503 TaxID=1121345 RepID=A0A1M7YK26_9FIRM|nr:D-alanine--D-alanine ligase family protein [Anaerocolumna xylanovorans]SHO52952.1 D-alanine-D-alanine ligase [Anaerocolumna xylanovorans DSM 12503]
MSKKTVAVLFGGQSSEHEVSCISATTVINNINTGIYNIVIIGITKEGKWLKVNNTEEITSGSWRQNTQTAVILPDASMKCAIILNGEKAESIKIDVVFPVLHGLYGEDGTIQGLLELARIPYVGCGVLASAVSMDKLYTKIVVDALGIRQAKYVAVTKKELSDMAEAVKKVEKELSYPVFIKPSNAGSSRGISKAGAKEELIEGLKLASEHDRKILVEETINGREVECAVLGGNEPKASGVGEIIAAAQFYDYDAKYNNAESKTVLSPELPAGAAETIRDYAIRIFKAVDGHGLSRVDFFVDRNTGEVIFNEINTMPGFTSISMYPMLWEGKGIGKPQLVEKLLQLAFTRAAEAGGESDAL